ncbi:acetylornithine aminotransferase [Dispira parvispora]|uniref:acetylornithine transaminase n=1 Tax=Dispira parvispora TaxID=1520584 RepID=A0A9W8AI66_9FUNG|nr:acetylornithine aminotransferase [Dispira parvispora]
MVLWRARSLSRVASRTRTSSGLSMFTPTMVRQPARWNHQAVPPYGDSNATAATVSRIDKYQKYTLGVYQQPPMILAKGQGCWVYDTDGRRFLDLSAGIAVNALGHADPQVAQVVGEQAQRLVHLSNLYHNEWSGPLAERLVKTTFQTEQARVGSEEVPAGFNPGKVFFSNSGTEANEGALKFAKKYGNWLAGRYPDRYPQGKQEIVAFSNGFHGRSMGALSATAAPKYQKPFLPLVPGFHHVDFNDTSAMIDAINDRTCAVILEPIQGEGGINMATPEFLAAVRQRCDEMGALLIYDEIQCGIGRTGKLWGFQNYDSVICHPDILTMAKPLANGVPIGAVMLADHVAEVIVAGDHGTTFGGNPLACRVALHVFERISQPEFLERVHSTGEYFKSRVQSQLQAQFPKLIREVRGLGLMIGVEFSQNPAPLVQLARERGMLIITAGNNTVRFVPPLIITEKEIDTAVDILGDCLKAWK